MRIVKWTIRAGIAVALVGVGAALLSATSLGSYVFSGGRYVTQAVVDAVPIEFELRRARDMIEELIPEMHANIRQIAEEEVEIELIEAELRDARTRLAEHRAKLARLRDTVGTDEVRYQIAGQSYTREELKHDLARRLEQCQNAEDVLAGKERLLASRRAALRAAQKHLAEIRAAKHELTAQVATLESQFRLIQASSAGTDFELRTTKLAEARRLLKSVKKRLDVAQRVLEKEQHFVEHVPVETPSDTDLLEPVATYLSAPRPSGNGDESLAVR